MRDRVDEIIVVDNGSSDATPEIAREHGGQVIVATDGPTDALRNLYLEKVRTSWVLVLDADERLAEAGWQMLRARREDAPAHVMAYRSCYYQYTGEGRFSHQEQVRFFRSHPRIRYARLGIHNGVGQSIRELGGTIEPAGPRIHHLDLLVFRRSRAKRESYRSLLEAEQRSAGTLSAFLHGMLALECQAAGEDDRAKALLWEGIGMGGPFETFLKLLCAQLLADEDPEQAIGLARDVLAAGNPVQREQALVLIAAQRLACSDVAGAILECRRAAECHPRSAAADLNLAMLHRLAREPRRALAHARAALEKNEYLAMPLVYGPGDGPHLFATQRVLLAETPSLYELMIGCSADLGDRAGARAWRECWDSVRDRAGPDSYRAEGLERIIPEHTALQTEE